MPEWVLIEHAQVPESKTSPPSVTRESYDEVWRKNGWRLHKPPAAAAPAKPATTTAKKSASKPTKEK